MVPNNYDIDRKIKSSQSTITASSIFVALGVATMALLVSQPSVKFGYNATVISAVNLIFAIVLFLVAIEFFILCIHHCEHIDWFGLVGSCLYALGAMFIVVGISVGLVAFDMRPLSYVFLSVSFLGYLSYYIMRMWKLGREGNIKTRMIFRGVYLLQVILGYIFIATVGG